MAKIELAYNTEIGEDLTPSEANERYLERNYKSNSRQREKYWKGIDDIENL